MSNKFPLLLALSVVGGCYEPDTVIVDPPAAIPLQNGIYTMRVEEVVDLDCDVSARELRDWKAELALAIKGREANAVIEGQVALSGSAKGAFVYLDGHGPSSRPEDDKPPQHDDEDCGQTEPDEPSREDEDRDERGEDGGERHRSKRHGDCGDDSGRSEPHEGGGETSSDGESYDTESGEAADVAEPEYQESFSLDLEAIDAQKGRGVFVVNMPGCYAELDVSVRWQRELERRRGGDEPVPLHEEEGEVEPEEEECGEEYDCG